MSGSKWEVKEEEAECLIEILKMVTDLRAKAKDTKERLNEDRIRFTKAGISAASMMMTGADLYLEFLEKEIKERWPEIS